MNIWVQVETVLTSSTDLAVLFASQLGLQALLSDRLQGIAKRFTREIMISEGDDQSIHEILERFQSTVSAQLGDDALKTLKSWQQFAFPPHAQATRLWVWQILLEVLRQRWDEDEPETSIPLTSPQLAWARILVRNYVDAVRNSRLEVEKTNEHLGSTWDGQLTRACDWFSIVSVISNILSQSLSREFWIGIKSNLDHSQLDQLQSWGQTVCKERHISSVYARLPSIDLRE